MKKEFNATHLLLILSLLISSCFILNSCGELLNLPRQGVLTGYVVDKLTRDPIPNVLIIAEYIEPNDAGGTEREQRFFTTDEGYFQLENIWDEARIVTELKGFQPLHFFFEIEEGHNEPVTIELLGKPIIYDFFFEDEEISQSKDEETVLRVEVEDLYNENLGGDFRVFVFFTNTLDGHSEAGFEMEQIVKSDHFANFKVDLNANDFPKLEEGEKFVLKYLIEIEDPDKNVYDYFSKDLDPLLTVTH